MTVKSSDASAPRYSGALAALKKAEDEKFVDVDWYDKDTDEAWNCGDRLLKTVREPLIPITRRDEYIDMLRDSI